MKHAPRVPRSNMHTFKDRKIYSRNTYVYWDTKPKKYQGRGVVESIKYPPHRR